MQNKQIQLRAAVCASMRLHMFVCLCVLVWEWVKRCQISLMWSLHTCHIKSMKLKVYKTACNFTFTLFCSTSVRPCIYILSYWVDRVLALVIWGVTSAVWPFFQDQICITGANHLTLVPSYMLKIKCVYFLFSYITVLVQQKKPSQHCITPMIAPSLSCHVLEVKSLNV